jgi:hypothetical protein
MCGRYIPSLLRKDDVQSLNMFWFEIRKEHNPIGALSFGERDDGKSSSANISSIFCGLAY